jgi:hypothetical protein
LRPRCYETFDHAFVLQLARLKYLQAAGDGELLDGALRSPQAASCGTVGLRQHQGHVMAGSKQCRQRTRCEIWSAGEY